MRNDLTTDEPLRTRFAEVSGECHPGNWGPAAVRSLGSPRYDFPDVPRVEITELWGFEGDLATRLETQRRFYRDVVAACVAVDACRATTLWLFTDRYPTTIERTLGQDAMPLVFDGDYRRKPAYFGVRAGLLAVPRP